MVVFALAVAIGMGSSESDNFLTERVTILLGGLWYAYV